MNDAYFNRQQLANMLHCTTRTIYNYVQSGSIPKPQRIGRRHLWPKDEFFGFIKLQQSPPEEYFDPNSPTELKK